MSSENSLLKIQDFLENIASNNSNSPRHIRFIEIETQLREPKKVMKEYFEENGDQDEVSNDLLLDYSFEIEEIYNWSIDLFSILEQNKQIESFESLKVLLEEMFDNDSRSWLIQKHKADYKSDYENAIAEDDNLTVDKKEFDNNSILFFNKGKFYLLDQVME
jgi:hypothetical protein